MSKLAPSRRPDSMRARLLAVEALLHRQPHTAETLATALGDVTAKTAQAYLLNLRDEGRARVRCARAQGRTQAVHVYLTDETPPEMVAEALAAIEAKRAS